MPARKNDRRLVLATEPAAIALTHVGSIGESASSEQRQARRK
jgi:hypothetical protein